MGLFSDGLDARLHATTGLAELMRPAVEAWYDAHIQIIDPKSDTTTDYDPLTDTGGSSEPEVIWDSGEQGAIVQPLRSQTIGDYGSQAIGLVAIRFQASIPDEVDLRGGLQVKVLDGGGDKEVERHTYVIGSGIDSSLRWVTRITATVVST